MYGFDPRLFSESLMRNCSDLAHTGKYPTHEPKRLLCHAFDRVQTENCFGTSVRSLVILMVDAFLRRQRHRLCCGRRLSHRTTSFGQYRRLRLSGRSRRPSRLSIAIAEDEWRLSKTIGCVPVDGSVEVEGPQLHANFVRATFFLVIRSALANVHSLVRCTRQD